jgi:polyhydroxyalkanoate synthesis repressor PhaR
MPLIKRYPNRKLYNTEVKHYITLEGIAELIRQGQSIQVIDHATGEDLTAVVLTQIIYKQEKKQGGFLPHAALAELMQTGNERLNALQRNLAAQLGLDQPVEEEIKRRIQALIRQGELAETEGKRILDKLLAYGVRTFTSASIPGEAEIEQVLQKKGVPSRQDLEKILEQLEALSRELDQLGKRKA